MKMMYVEKFFSKEGNITETDLKLFLSRNNERAKIEFKASISNKRDAILEPVTSFANSLGGLLILGISDAREIIGLNREDTKERINEIIKSSIEPKSFSSTNYYDIHEIGLSNGKKVFLIDIKAPTFIVGFRFNGNYYYYERKGNSKSLLTPQELHDASLFKGTYSYNQLYRYRILNALLSYDDLYNLLTNRESKAISLSLIIIVISIKSKSYNKCGCLYVYEKYLFTI